MEDEKIERHHIFCNAFDLKIGDIIKVNGWYTYIVETDRFYFYDNNIKKYSKYQPYEQIIERGFKVISQ